MEEAVFSLASQQIIITAYCLRKTYFNKVYQEQGCNDPLRFVLLFLTIYSIYIFFSNENVLN